MAVRANQQRVMCQLNPGDVGDGQVIDAGAGVFMIARWWVLMPEVALIIDGGY